MPAPWFARFRRPRWIIAIVAAAALAAFVGFQSVYHWKRTRRFCFECGSERVVEVHRLYSWDGPRVPGTTDIDEFRPSDALEPYFAKDHVHHWGVFPGPPIRLGIWGVTQCGDGLPGPILARFRKDPAFREFLRAEVARGRLSVRDVADLLPSPSNLGPGRYRVPLLSEARVKELSAKAGPVLATYVSGDEEWVIPSWLRDSGGGRR